MTPAEQARAFAAMLITGACLGTFYDLLRPMRHVRGLCAVTDLLFGACSAAGIVMTALELRCDAFRLYAFAGVACGMALYGVTAGTVWRRIAAVFREKIGNGKEKYKIRSSPAGN